MARVVDVVIEHNIPQVRQRLATFARSLDDVSDPIGEFVESIPEMAAKSFRERGPGWQPLSPEYARRKPAGRPLLVRDGGLRSSVTSMGGYTVRRSRDEALVSFRHPVAKFHQGGTSQMPARPILRVTPKDKRRLRSRIVDFLVNRARRIGFRLRRLGF